MPSLSRLVLPRMGVRPGRESKIFRIPGSDSCPFRSIQHNARLGQVCPYVVALRRHMRRAELGTLDRFVRKGPGLNELWWDALRLGAAATGVSCDDALLRSLFGGNHAPADCAILRSRRCTVAFWESCVTIDDGDRDPETPRLFLASVPPSDTPVPLIHHSTVFCNVFAV